MYPSSQHQKSERTPAPQLQISSGVGRLASTRMTESSPFPLGNWRSETEVPASSVRDRAAMMALDRVALERLALERERAALERQVALGRLLDLPTAEHTFPTRYGELTESFLLSGAGTPAARTVPSSEMSPLATPLLTLARYENAHLAASRGYESAASYPLSLIHI